MPLHLLTGSATNSFCPRLHVEGHTREQDTPYRVMQHHATKFTAHTEASTSSELPRIRQGWVRRFPRVQPLSAPVPEAALRECGHDRLPPFSCKHRGICQWCGACQLSGSSAEAVGEQLRVEAVWKPGHEAVSEVV